MLCKDLAGNRLCSVSKHRPLETRLSERYILELTVTGCPDKIRKLVSFNLLDKYILQFGQIHFVIQTNTLCNSDKSILQFKQIHFAIQTNTFCSGREDPLDMYQRAASGQSSSLCVILKPTQLQSPSRLSSKL